MGAWSYNLCRGCFSNCSETSLTWRVYMYMYIVQSCLALKWDKPFSIIMAWVRVRSQLFAVIHAVDLRLRGSRRRLTGLSTQDGAGVGIGHWKLNFVCFTWNFLEFPNVLYLNKILFNLSWYLNFSRLHAFILPVKEAVTPETNVQCTCIQCMSSCCSTDLHGYSVWSCDCYAVRGDLKRSECGIARKRCQMYEWYRLVQLGTAWYRIGCFHSIHTAQDKQRRYPGRYNVERVCQCVGLRVHAFSVFCCFVTTYEYSERRKCWSSI